MAKQSSNKGSKGSKQGYPFGNTKASGKVKAGTTIVSNAHKKQKH